EPSRPNDTPWARNCTLVHWRGSPARSVSTTTLSRRSAFALGSPPSSASVQYSACGCVGSHSTPRGPVGTPPIGTSSRSGKSPTTLTTAPSLPRTATRCGNAFHGTRYENGRCSTVASTNSPSGDGSTSAISAGAPSFSTAPVSTATRASCDVARYSN